MLLQHARHNFENAIHRLEDRIIWHMLRAEFTERVKTRISDTEHRMTVTRHNVAGVQRFPGILLELFLGRCAFELLDRLKHPAKAFLIGQTVEGTSQAIQPGGD